MYFMHSIFMKSNVSKCIIELSYAIFFKETINSHFIAEIIPSEAYRRMRIFKLKSFRVLSNYSLKFYSSFQQEGQGEGGGDISVTLVYRAFPHLKLTLHFSSSVRHQICVDQSRFHIVLFSLFFFFPMGTSGNLSVLPFLYRICPCE